MTNGFVRQQKQSKLQSIHQREVAIGLSDIFIEQLAKQESDPVIADTLRKIRDIIWAQPEKTPRSANLDSDTERRLQDMHIIKGMLDNLATPEQKHQLAEAYVRLGHLYEIAGHAARENFFQERENKLTQFRKANPKGIPPRDLMTPGGVHELLFHDPRFKEIKDTNEVVELLSKPVSEYVFTQHPTNTNILDSMRLQRAIADALDKVTHLPPHAGPEAEQSWEALEDHIAKFGDAKNHPIVNLEPSKLFTALDETNISINFLSNAFKDLDRLYEVTERGLKRKFGDEYGEEQRWNLDLKQHFSSWGSAGDKDGNKEIKSENTLEAIILHKLEAARLYADSLEEVFALGQWKEKFDTAIHEYEELVSKMEAVRKGSDIPLTAAEFDHISGKAQEITQKLGSAEQFQADIKEACADVSQEDKEKLLAVHRKARIFGFNLGKIEYRETAEEYARVVNVLMKHAKEKFPNFVAIYELENFETNPEQRIDVLSEMLRTSDSAEQWAAIVQDFMQSLTGESAPENLRKYQDKLSPEDQKAWDAITLEEERLKEEAKGGEAKPLPDDMAAQKKDLKVKLEKITIKNDQTIAYHTLKRMELARDFANKNDANSMITHNVLAECKGTQNLLEALALQHAVAKNGKRALLNVVPLFEEAETMRSIPEVLDKGLDNDVYRFHLETLQERDKTPRIIQQIQIAHSDNARRAGAIASRGIIHGGHHAARDAIEKYNQHHVGQEVDLQFFEGGSQSDSYRNGVRAVTAVIKDFDLGNFAKMTFQGGDLLNYFNEPTSCERMMLRSIVEQAKLLENGNNGNGAAHHLEDEVVKTIEDLQYQYDQDYYGKKSNPIGKLLHALGYREQAKVGSAGTRGNRGDEDFSKEAITGVAAKAVRTIGFSEAFQHGGLHPSCLGTKSLENDLSKRLFANEKAKQELTQGFIEFTGENMANPFNEIGDLNARGLHYLYEKASPTFRDAVDKMTYGLLNTRVIPLTNKLESYQQSLGGRRDKTLDDAFRDVLQEYRGIAELVYKAHTGKEFTKEEHRAVNQDGNDVKILDRMINLLRSIKDLDHLEPLIYKHKFVDGLDIIEKVAGLENSRLTHNGRDTLYHGRMFTADDRNYGKALTQVKREQSEQRQVAV